MTMKKESSVDQDSEESLKTKKSKKGFCKRSDFEVQSLLGEGSLSRVYLALNLFTKQPVALKVVPKHKVYSKAIFQSILLERDTLLSLTPHPNFVDLISCFQDDLYLYFQLELVSGGSLTDILERFGVHISKRLTFYWICDAVNILTHLRSKHIAHRDIKPDNLLMDEHHRLKLIDFNNAVFVKHDPKGNLFSLLENVDIETSATNAFSDVAEPTCSLTSQPFSQGNHEIFGALHYLPPEAMFYIAPTLFEDCGDFQCRFTQWKIQNTALVKVLQKQVPPYAIDIWNFGCVLFEIFSGCHPFKADSDVETVFNVLNYSICPLPSFIQKEVADLITKMLHQIPEKRLGVFNIIELTGHPFFFGVDLAVIPYTTSRPSLPSLEEEDLVMQNTYNEESTLNHSSEKSCTLSSPFVGILDHISA